MFVVQVEGMEIWICEGIGNLFFFYLIQMVYVNNVVVQCGYCILGLIMSMKVFFDYNLCFSEVEIWCVLDGNLCCCMGYVKIMDVVNDVVEQGVG